MSKGLQFGISTTVFREHPVAFALERIAQAGYAAAEVWAWHLEGSGEDPRDLARLARRLKLALTLHAPTENVNPASRDAEVARQSRSRIASALELAVELGAPLVAVHPGRRDSPLDHAGKAWVRQEEWLSKLDELAVSLGLQVGLELMEKGPLEICALPKDARRLMEASYKRIGLTVDLAHLNTHGDPVQLLGQLDPSWIIHVHLSDNVPWQVHLPLGEGRMDIAAVLAAVGRVYSGLVSLEGSIPGRGNILLKRNLAYLQKLGYV